MIGWFVAGFVTGELMGLIIAAILIGSDWRRRK